MSKKWKEIVIRFALRRKPLKGDNNDKNNNVDKKLNEEYDIKKESNDLTITNIFKLDEYAFEIIFKYLSLNDLRSLSKTCKIIEETVKRFSMHYLFSYSNMDKAQKYLETSLLTWEEIWMKKKVEDFSSNQTLDFDLSPILLKYINYNGHFVVRSSIKTATVVNKRNQYQRSRYVGMVNCPSLGRHYLVLRQPCGITFSKTFSRLCQGNYNVSIRVQLPKILEMLSQKTTQKWKDQYTTLLTVKTEPCNTIGNAKHYKSLILAQAFLEPWCWNKFSTEEHNKIDFEIGNLSISREPQFHDSGSKISYTLDWFFIKLRQPFLVKTLSDVKVEWKDVLKYEDAKVGLWKVGMAFDFVQLEKL